MTHKKVQHKKGAAKSVPKPAPGPSEAEISALAKRLFDDSPLESDDAKRGLISDWLDAGSSIAWIRARMLEGTAGVDEIRAVAGLLSGRRRTLEALKLTTAAPKKDPFSLDGDDEDEAPAPKQEQGEDEDDANALLKEIAE